VDHTAGWNIWANSGARLRQFSVAAVAEADALAILTSAIPDLVIVSRHTMDRPLIQKLGLAPGKFCEWVPLDAKEPPMKPGGVPIDKPMPSR
jgi:hypothetical protein